MRRQAGQVEDLNRGLVVHQAAHQRGLVVGDAREQTKRGAARGRQQSCAGWLEAAAITLQEGQGRRLAIEPGLCTLEQIELAVAVQVQPKRAARATFDVGQAHRFGHVDEATAEVVEQPLRLGAHALDSPGELHQVRPAVVVEVAPGRAVLVALQLLGQEGA